MTCSVDNTLDPALVRRQTFLALFTALAVAIHTVEVLLPSPVPWFRLGLANVLTAVVLFLYDGRAAWSLTLTRIGLGALLLGRLFSPGFLLALAGGSVATLLMTIFRRRFASALSPVGISVLGAAGHAAGQVVVAWLLVVKHAAVWKLFPFLLLSSLVAGLVTGWLATVLLEHLRQYPIFPARSVDDSCRGEG